jgi:nitric oxide reductase subunit C
MSAFLILALAYIVCSTMVYTTGTDTAKIEMSENAIGGKLLYQKFNCSACHQIYGLGGYLGPDLTTIVSERGNDTKYINALLKSGSQRMPNFQLSDEETQNIIAYLKYLTEVSLTDQSNINK